MKRLLTVSFALSFALGAGCSTAKVRVMPGEDGNHRVVVRDIERDDSEEEAVDAAKEYCEDGGKKAVFVNTGSKYTGSMDEGTRNTVRKASKVAGTVGAITSVPGSTRPYGGVLGMAGIVGTGMTNDRDYESEVFFKCK
ncbi:MAG TPA: hypothetical protein VM598_09385 [Bdellovibrionota bacterium]|nr:hypothetical protein [Bdellovibrionota bacterium]